MAVRLGKVLGSFSGWLGAGHSLSRPPGCTRTIRMSTCSTRASKRILWIDTDAGVDDAQGLMLAAAHPGTEIVGISTVHGNTELENVGNNVLRVLTACGASSTPVYVGAGEPLVGEPRTLPDKPYHGHDGLGDAPEVWPSQSQVSMRLGEGSAVMKLIECSVQHGGELNVLALGPLTNIALAVKLDPDLPRRIQRLVVMGGAHGPGNMGPQAEFNFFCDPEAARIVMQKFSNIVLVPRDLGLSHPLPWSQLEPILAKDTPKARFLSGISADSFRSCKQQEETSYMTHDPQAVAIALEPGSVTASKRLYCDVETQGSHLTRGMSVFDWEDQLSKQPNVELVMAIDVQALLDLFERAL